jgi:hypothetical protein
VLEAGKLKRVETEYVVWALAAAAPTKKKRIAGSFMDKPLP